MNIYFPSYYHDFRCIAGACPDSCCKDWAVDVDPQAAAYYRSLPGALGDRLRSILQDTDGGTEMTIEDGRCPMWRQDGLCRIQAELGHDVLCKTCREFPRLTHDYGDFTEYGLELSCPEAARLILTDRKFRILTETKDGGEPPEYDAVTMAILRESRETALQFLTRSDYPLPQALAIILLYAHSVQAQIDGGDRAVLQPEACLVTAGQHAGTGDMQSVFTFFAGLEILTPEWKARLTQMPVKIDWSDTLKAMMVYMIHRYWLQAIADYDLICRVKLSIVACLLVGGLGGDPIQTAQLFSKEIENDADNIESILDGAYTAPALTDLNLLSLLLA